MITRGTVLEPLPARDAVLGRGTHVRRFLPNKARRMVGPWCFVDHYGPDDVRQGGGLWVPPHPYVGLQALTWLFEGALEHRDSLGGRQCVGAGELGLLTAGTGVCRAEVSPPDAPNRLHGVLLWAAMPHAARTTVAPVFTRLAAVPTYSEQGVTLRVLMGTLAGEASPAPTFGPLVAAELSLEPGAAATLPLDVAFEHALLVVRGAASVDGEQVGREEMVYLGDGREGLELVAPPDGDRTVLLLLGGAPFVEEVVLWWNFLGRDHEEVARLREDWNGEGESWVPPRFGEVPGFDGPRMLAPPLPPVRLRPGTPGT